jgi:hypothetical protein
MSADNNGRRCVRIELRSADFGHFETMEPKSKADYRMLHLFYNLQTQIKKWVIRTAWSIKIQTAFIFQQI